MTAFMFGYIVLGLAAGAFSGLIGIGGGIIVVPALVMIFGYSQHSAQGTTLAMMIPPIGILAAYSYYARGEVNIKAAALLCAGFIIGGLIGAKGAGMLTDYSLHKVFGALLLVVGTKMLFFS